MAGIGFELRRLFVGKGVFQKIRAYAYAGMICSGTTLMGIILLVGLEQIAKASGASVQESRLLVTLMVYALVGSLLLTSLLQMLLSRFIADRLYEKQYERILPSLYGGALLLMALGAPFYIIILLSAKDVPVAARVFNLALFLEMQLVWLQMAYITAVKDYKKIMGGFALGVASAAAVAMLLLRLGVGPAVALQAAVFTGYGVMAVIFTAVLHEYFPVGSGSLFYFIEYFGRYPSLVAIGFLSMAGAFIHMFIMWFGPLGEVVSGMLRQAPKHDVASFYGFLVMIPTTINFIVSVEVNFYEKYRTYFGLVTSGGTLPEIEVARREMNVMLRQELTRLAQVQVLLMVPFMILMKYFLSNIGFTTDMMLMFRLLCVGYSAYSVGNSVMLLQLYFDDRKGALYTCLALNIGNFVGTWVCMNIGPVYYGLGMVIAGALMYVVGVALLMAYVKEIDFHVYCGQPVLAIQRRNRLRDVAHWLDERASRDRSIKRIKIKKAKKSTPAKEVSAG